MTRHSQRRIMFTVAHHASKLNFSVQEQLSSQPVSANVMLCRAVQQESVAQCKGMRTNHGASRKGEANHQLSDEWIMDARVPESASCRYVKQPRRFNAGNNRSAAAVWEPGCGRREEPWQQKGQSVCSAVASR